MWSICCFFCVRRAAFFFLNLYFVSEQRDKSLKSSPCFPCFPPAVVRGARRQQRQRGAVNGKPAPLPCELEEGRNRRSLLPREPNAKTSYRGGLLSPVVLFLHCILCVWGGVPTVSYHVKLLLLL